MAAIDPFHAHDKPRALDATIVKSAEAFARAFGGGVHVAHCYWPLAQLFPSGVMEPAVLAVTAAERKTYDASMRRQFAECASGYGVVPRRRHLRRGDPVVQLPRLARSLKASMVVMGAVSRSGLKHLFIGATAERILDELSCDVLVVKSEYN